MTTLSHDDLVERYLTGWWTKTRSFMIYRLMYRAGPLLDLIHGHDPIDDELSARIKTEIEHALAKAFGRRPDHITPNTPRQYAIWDAVPAVWPRACELVQLIKKDKAVRGLSDVKPERALGQLLKKHLDACRMKVDGISEHETRVWAKLRRISEVLMNEYQTKHGTPPWPGYRCSSDHFKQIRARILLDMQDDDMIAKLKLSTIEDYFGRFCDECRDFIDLDEVSDTLIGGGSWEYDAKDQYMLQKCIDQLDESLRVVVHVAYFQDRNVIPISIRQVDESERRRGEVQSDREFERLRREALRQLRICFGERSQEKLK